MNTTEHATNNGQGITKIPNKLITEKSPYLLQHAYNPVNWYPWGPEAFEIAKTDNKPIFLSIGYSTCHWCHVMAHECFEDRDVATLLNQFYICIKVDKEERPDIDNIYMSVCQAVTGQGGWPLTILMTSDQKPFYAATYIPKETRNQIPGLIDILMQVHKQWVNNQEALLRSGDQITNTLKREYESKKKTGEATKELISLAVTQFKQNFDHNYGGFGNPPKFPSPHNLIFLLRYACLENDVQTLFLVEATLEHMYRGGIFDHIGYGFSRYSTDAKWLVPHFEKMLYDNALLAITYLEAYQYTKKDLYRVVSEQIFDYISKEMTDREGGFYSAQDADSEGVEGKYYVFTPGEINEVLGEEDGSYFNNYFDITRAGNFEGASIPNLIHCKDIRPKNEKITRLCEKVYSYRLNRAKLHKDDKILTSWNALMITAYAKAALILQKESYADTAKKAIDFINTKLTTDTGRLYVRYRDGDAAYFGHIDDYAFYCMALLSMYEATFDLSYLSKAISIADQMLDQFWDMEHGGFYLYAKDSEQLIYRPKEVYDGAIPAGNSVAAYVLQRIASITTNTRYQEFATKQMSFLAGQVKDYPVGFSFSMLAFLGTLYPTKEIVCVCDEKEECEDLFSYLATHYEPNTISLLKTSKSAEELSKIVDYVEDYHILNDKPTYYICSNKTCAPPSNDLKGCSSTDTNK